LLLGWLNPDFFLGGKIRLNVDAARDAIDSAVARPLGMETIAAADGIVKIVNSQMVEALRLVTVARGEDPREYAAVTFGGAGPVHAAQLARELNILKVIIPAWPGVASAMGLLISDLKRDYLRTRFAHLEEIPVDEVCENFAALERSAAEELASEGIAVSGVIFERALDLRYGIQKYELTVPVKSGALNENDKAGWRRAFDQRHEQQYGTRASDQKVEIVNYRLTARLPLPKPEPVKYPLAGDDPEQALKQFRRAYFDGWVDCPVYDRLHLANGNRIAGPAIIEQVDSTTVIHPSQKAAIDEYGNIVIEAAL
jgi:N-methylhydantoinase A